MFYEHRLLIVESPVTATFIEQLHIPWLSVFSTQGYLWKPQIDKKANKLSFKAIPEKRDKRKELSELASTAVTIFAATDSDPSGEFIYHSIQRYLKRDIKRIYLSTLTRFDILNQLESDETTTADYTLLYNLLLANQTLTPPLINTRFSSLHELLSWFHFYKINYASESENRDFITFFKNSHKKAYLTTQKILLNAINTLNFSSFKEIYSTLLSLHQLRFQEQYMNLITYPRTAAEGFFGRTWNNLALSKNGNLLLTQQLQTRLHSQDAHESIRVTSFTHTPDKVMIYLSPKQLTLYKFIYQNSLSVFYPDTDYLNQLTQKWKDSSILSMNISELPAYISRNRIAETLDSLLSKGLLELKQNSLHVNSNVFQVNRHLDNLLTELTLCLTEKNRSKSLFPTLLIKIKEAMKRL